MVINRSNLTDRDRQILDTMIHRVRVLTVGQIGRTWFGPGANGERAARRRLARLVEVGLVECFRVRARPELRLASPLVVWTPAEAPPDFEKLAYRLTLRWRETVAWTEVVIATKHAGTWFGGAGGRRPRVSEVSHDITLGGVYLAWLGLRRAPGDNWLSEAALRTRGYGDRQRLPDAMIESGDRLLVIEVAGAYPGRKLADFHAFCQDHGLPYELW